MKQEIEFNSNIISGRISAEIARIGTETSGLNGDPNAIFSQHLEVRQRPNPDTLTLAQIAAGCIKIDTHDLFDQPTDPPTKKAIIHGMATELIASLPPNLQIRLAIYTWELRKRLCQPLTKKDVNTIGPINDSVPTPPTRKWTDGLPDSLRKDLDKFID